jgi:uncharacterized membrane protein
LSNYVYNFIMSVKLTSKASRLDREIAEVEKMEEHLEKVVDREEKELKEIEGEEEKIEKEILRVGNFALKRSHFLELARGTAGAFLGVGLGQALGGSVKTAQTLPWVNTLGILLFVLLLVGVLINKNDKDSIKKSNHHPIRYVFNKLVVLYCLSLIVQLLGLFLFNNFPGWNIILVKSLIVGSYAAMSSAVAFTLI